MRPSAISLFQRKRLLMGDELTILEPRIRYFKIIVNSSTLRTLTSIIPISFTEENMMLGKSRSTRSNSCMPRIMLPTRRGAINKCKSLFSIKLNNP